MGESSKKACIMVQAQRKKTPATRRGQKTSHDLLSYLPYEKKKQLYSTGGQRQQTLSPLGTGTNPQEREQENPSSLKGEAEICPQHGTTNGENLEL